MWISSSPLPLRLLAALGALVASRSAAAAPVVVAAPAAATTPTAADAVAPAPAVYGLYPLWESTGAVDAHGAARVGLRRAQVTLGRVTVATDPYLDLYDTYNAGLKLGLLREGRLRLALAFDAVRVPAAAETRTIGNLHAGAFSNPYSPVTLLPASASATWLAARSLHVHATATWLPTFSEAPALRTNTGGVTGWVEWFASPHYSARLHAGAEGWPAAPTEHVGVSFGLRTTHLALQGGYARRFAPEGTSANTLMFDGALLFP